MASLVLTLRETLRYRGAIGQWSWVLHRLTGLGVVLFLVLHVIDTSWAFFYPDLYEGAIASYQSPLFTIGEFGLVFAVIFHALNGLRIGILDFRPDLWRYQKQAAYYVFGATVLVLVPVFIGMFGHVIVHYQKPDVYVMPLTEVLVKQLPFVAGIVAAGIGALILSFLVGMVTGGGERVTVSAKQSGSRIERFWWSFMRVSGLLIVPLVFGHLAAMHVLQGVFDLTLAGSNVVGVVPTADTALAGDALAAALASGDPQALMNGLNDTGTATEFVAERWNLLWNGIALWRLYDVALLALVTIHGFNGLRYVLTDYTMERPLLRRASVYFSVIGALVLLIVGAGAMIGTIDTELIAMAQESICKMNPAHATCGILGS